MFHIFAAKKMTLLETKEFDLNTSAEKIFLFLEDMNNHKLLMPENIINWQADSETCSFEIKGTGKLNLKFAEKISPEKITLVPHIKVPFPFTLSWLIKTNEYEICSVKAILEADMNSFVKIIAEKPLQNFINFQAENLNAYFTK